MRTIKPIKPAKSSKRPKATPAQAGVGSLAQVLQDLQPLLVHPQEGLDVEIKGWLNLTNQEHRADLAKALLALANHGGGHVVIGFDEKGGALVPAEPRPPDLSGYSQDIVNDIVQGYADPPFHCPVFHVPHPSTKLLFPIIRVPGEHRVPIRARRDGPNKKHVAKDSYYIRRPGPHSEPPQSSQEWEELIGRCVIARRDELVDAIRKIGLGLATTELPPIVDVDDVPAPAQPSLGDQTPASQRLENWESSSFDKWSQLIQELPTEHPGRLANGRWSVSYLVAGNLKHFDLPEFIDVLRKVKGRETGWPPWWVPTKQEIAPYPVDGLVECWLARGSFFEDPGHSDFWRASPKGMMFLVRGYQEDGHKEFPRGTRFDVTLPVWRVGECLLHASRLAEVLGHGSSITVRFIWTGLKGRQLVAWANPDRDIWDARESKTESVRSELQMEANQISSNLPEFVLEVTKPLYAAFGFFKLPLVMVDEEISRMLARTMK